jgi:hypothetical protein
MLGKKEQLHIHLPAQRQASQKYHHAIDAKGKSLERIETGPLLALDR